MMGLYSRSFFGAEKLYQKLFLKIYKKGHALLDKVVQPLEVKAQLLFRELKLKEKEE